MSARRKTTLSDFEKEQKEEVLDSVPKTVTTIVALADAIGVSRVTLHRWRKEMPNFPKAQSNGKWDVREVMEFITAQNLAAKPDDGGPLTEKEKLEVRRLQAICERLEFQHACERGDYLAKTEVRRQIAEATHVLRRALRSFRGSLAPEVAGLDVEEAGIRIEKAVDALLAQLHHGVWEGGNE